MRRLPFLAVVAVVATLTFWACKKKEAEGPVPMTNAMAQALFQGDTAKVAQLLDAGESLNCEQEGKFPLTIAAMNGRIDLARWLITRGASVEQRDAQGRTPLMWAALRGQLDLAQLLMQQGANINSTTSLGETPLMGAVARQHIDVARELLARGADPMARTNNGRTAYIMARELNDTPLVLLLTEKLGNDTAQALQVIPRDSGAAAPAADSASAG